MILPKNFFNHETKKVPVMVPKTFLNDVTRKVP